MKVLLAKQYCYVERAYILLPQGTLNKFHTQIALSERFLQHNALKGVCKRSFPFGIYWYNPQYQFNIRTTFGSYYKDWQYYTTCSRRLVPFTQFGAILRMKQRTNW